MEDKNIPALTGMIFSIAKQVPETAGKTATDAAEAAEQSKEAAEAASTIAQQHAWGVTVESHTLVFTEPTGE